MAKIVGLSGSLRRGSYNTALLHAAIGLLPEASDLTVHTIEKIPLYDADGEAEHGVPQVVGDLKEEIAASDGLLIASPEYNNSIPGVLKNAVDWLSRPPSDIERVFGGKPVAVIGATPGGFGTILSQVAWLPILRHLGTRPWQEGRLLISQAHTLFDENHNLTDKQAREQLRDFLRGFITFASREASIAKSTGGQAGRRRS
jgi:chromate reductase, NAD(P)H dehydrogenase (quinone)